MISLSTALLAEGNTQVFKEQVSLNKTFKSLENK